MKTYQKVYEHLKQSPDFVNGEQLAQELGLSRTAIWKAIQTLQEQGIAIESIRKKGYRLKQGDLLLPQQISDELQIPVYYNPESQSTQIDAKQGIEKHHPTPALYLAPHQEMAKGRFERDFYADPHGGIYMSLHLKPDCPYTEVPPYTMMVAVAIVKAIQKLTGIDTQIKWVNDIYLGKKKLAGILTEAISSIESGHISDVIIGIGLNFAISDFPEHLRDKATSLFPDGQTKISRNDLINEIWNIFMTTPTDDLIKVYKEKSLVLDRQVTFLERGKTYTGQAISISDKGELEILLTNGQNKWLRSGEVSLISW